VNAGTYAVTASFPGTSDYNPVSDASQQVVIAPAATTVALTSSLNPTVVGQPVAFTAVVAPVSPGGGTPVGSVVFKNGATVLATVPLAVVNGTDQAAFSTAALPAGADAVTATYVNTDDNELGSSASLSQTVLGPGVYAVGTTLYVVGADTADSAQISPAGSKADGTTGLRVSSTLNNVWSSRTFN
jgi:hypothetical protein